MSHIFAPHSAASSPIVLSTPTPSQVITPSQAPVAASSPTGTGTTPSFLGSAVLPPSSSGGAPQNQKKLLGS